MKSSLLKSVLASGLLLTAGFAVAQDTEPAPKPKLSHIGRVPRKKPAPVAKTAVKTVDINRASKDDLMKLPGITAALADKIIAGRPYMSKSKLVTQNVLPEKLYMGLREQIAAVYVAPAKKP